MSRHDYTQHSKKIQNEVAEVNEVNEELESEVIEPAEDPVTNVEVEEVKEAEVQQPVESKTYGTGTVTGCIRLRVRSKPCLGDNVICELNQGTEVLIDKSESTFDYYKICTEAGIEGYCQKPYIK